MTELVLKDSEFRKLSRYVRQVCGINLHDGKKGLLRARLGKIIRERNFLSFTEYYDHLVKDRSGDELITLLDTISTNLTHFFREPKHFDFLAKEALPEIIKRKGFSKNLRFWCAGCSSGEEAYSMAIAACETVGGMRKTDFKILATDISTKALASARDGIYEEKRLGAIPYGLKRRYFQKGENKWVGYLRVKKEIRNKISFQRLNFVEEFQLGELFDVIFCRNVMIYFHTQEKAVLVNRLYQQLAQGGYLFLGHSESLTSNKYGLKYIQPSIYKKT